MVTQAEKKKKRDYEILTTLALLDMATRSQLQKIHHLGSNRNATRVLKNLEKYLNHFREAENVYYLNKTGRELVGSTKIVSRATNYEHTLMRNDIYVHFESPKMWSNENPIVTSEFTMVPDAFFSVKGTQYLLEVDRMQKMKKNMEKLLRYKRFKDMGLWQKKNMGRFPVVLFYTEKESRKHQLLESNPGIDLIVYTKEDLNF